MKTGQIDLFTRRIRKPKPPSEMALHCAVADTLRLDIAPQWIWLHCPNGELRDDNVGRKLKRMGVRPGVSDILLIGPPHGFVFALELKAKGEKPSQSQLMFIAEVKEAGGHATWVDNYKDAIRVLDEWGALRRKISVQ